MNAIYSVIKKYIPGVVTLLIVVVSVLGILLSLVHIDPIFFTRDDNADYFFPLYVYDWRSVVEQGVVPMINQHQFLGHEYIGGGQPAVVYPGVYIAVALSLFFTQELDATINIAVIMHLLIGAVGMLCLMRERKKSWLIAAIMAVAYITLPMIVTVSRSWISVAYTAAYMPWIFIALRRLLRSPSLYTVFALACAHALFLLQGNVQFTIMGGFFELLYICAFYWRQSYSVWLKPVMAFMFSCGIAVLFSLPLLLPMLHLFGVSVRHLFENPWVESLNIVIPLFVNMAFAQLFLGPNWWHIGFPLLAFLLILKQAQIRAWVVTPEFRVVALLAVTAWLFSDILAPLTYAIPVLGYFRWPWKYYVFFVFFLIWLIADVVQVLIERFPRRRYIFISMVFIGILLNVIRNLPGKDEALLSSAQVEEVPQSVSSHIDPSKGRVFPLFIEQPPEANFGRFYTFNFPTLYEVNAFSGYEPLVTQVAYDETFATNYRGIFYYDELTPDMREQLNRWSVRYFITEDTPESRERMAGISDIHELASEDHVVLYENLQARPYAFAAHDPLNPLFVEFDVNDVIILYPAQQPTMVTLSVLPQEGYELFFDGESQGAITQTDSEPVQITVPAGISGIRLHYTDRRFIFGALVSLTSFAIMIVVCLVYMLKRRFTSYRRS